MISLTHVLIVVVAWKILSDRKSVKGAARAMGEGARNFKKALKGEEDIDVTHTVKRIPDDEEKFR